MLLKGGLPMCSKLFLKVKLLRENADFSVQLQRDADDKTPNGHNMALVVKVSPSTGEVIGWLNGAPYTETTPYAGFNADADVKVGVPWTLSFYADATSILVHGEGIVRLRQFVNHGCRFKPTELNSIEVIALRGDLEITDVHYEPPKTQCGVCS
jgi:hypothetical protein